VTRQVEITQQDLGRTTPANDFYYANSRPPPGSP